MAKSEKRIEARKLRKEGSSIKMISNKLGVSTSTVSVWCRDIQLTNEQIAKLAQNARDPYYGNRAKYIASQKRKKQAKILRLLNKGKAEIRQLNDRELKLCGVALYWAEGFKKDNLVGFANSDPQMIQFFVLWLEKCCKISREDLKFRIGINENCKINLNKIEKFWATVLSVRKNQFQKTFFQKVKWKKIYEHPEDYHGVLRVRVPKSTDLLRKINGWIEGFKMQS